MLKWGWTWKSTGKVSTGQHRGERTEDRGEEGVRGPSRVPWKHRWCQWTRLWSQGRCSLGTCSLWVVLFLGERLERQVVSWLLPLRLWAHPSLHCAYNVKPHLITITSRLKLFYSLALSLKKSKSSMQFTRAFNYMPPLALPAPSILWMNNEKYCVNVFSKF